MILKAEDARLLVKKFEDDNLNYERKSILNRIEEQSKCGKKQLMLDFENLHMTEEDYEFFINLGYAVKRHKKQFLRPKDSDNCGEWLIEYGIVSWE
jgi:hypothetical protein